MKNIQMKEEICKGSCGEWIPIGHIGALTESCRTVIHHSNGICHYISKTPCDNCNA